MPDAILVFVFGTLRDAALRAIVLGAEVPARPARLEGAAIRRAAEGDWPTLAEAPGEAAEGLLLELAPEALARGDYYEGLFGYARRPAAIDVEGRAAQAEVWRPAAPPARTAEPWYLGRWQADHGPLAREAAREVMRLRGVRPAEETARRLPVLRARAQARLNAARGGPATLRRATRPGDVELLETRVPYAAFFAVEEYDLRHASFRGGQTDPMTRAAFVSADAVTVLPYDPVRDRVLVIEQFRAGPYARGDAQVWSLEAIAGRIDPGETPEETAHREAEEEAGVALGRLIPIAAYYPSPGAKTEFLYSYIGLADLPDDAARLGGLAEEHEDIRGHVIPYARLEELVETGEANAGPLLLTVLHLARLRDGLRREAGAA
jgi:nudix-type nucleoside diphosphatase (YffH/AdpP family)